MVSPCTRPARRCGSSKSKAAILTFKAVFPGKPVSVKNRLLDTGASPTGPLDTDDALAMERPQLRARGTLVDVEGVMQASPALRLARTPSGISSAAGDPAQAKK